MNLRSAAAAPFDAVIVGAGLSGLSLAAHLADSPWRDRRVLIVDDGARASMEGAWSFWTTDPGWLAPAVLGSWDVLGVHTSKTSRSLPIHPYRYHAVSGPGFRAAARDRAASMPRVAFERAGVTDVAQDAHSAHVRLDGLSVSARWVFDSRPSPSVTGAPFMQFLGWEVDALTDAFDSGEVTFMDFRGRLADRVCFTYVLPLTTRRALVEVAEFRWTSPATDLAEILHRYMDDILVLGDCAIGRTEAGVLPLARPQATGSPGRIVPIGMRGGMLKPSTGFALERIQRHSAAIAASLVAHDHPHDVRRSRGRHAWLDAVFLRVLRARPDLVEPVFSQLFERNSGPAILRFLDEDTSPAQEMRLISTLPAAPFITSGLRRGYG